MKKNERKKISDDKDDEVEGIKVEMISGFKTKSYR